MSIDGQSIELRTDINPSRAHWTWHFDAKGDAQG
jgi:hypothetical protein